MNNFVPWIYSHHEKWNIVVEYFLQSFSQHILS